MNLSKYHEVLEKSSLKTRVQAASSLDFLDLLESFGVDTSSRDFYKKQERFKQLINTHTDNVLRNLHEWERDGKPIDL